MGSHYVSPSKVLLQIVWDDYRMYIEYFYGTTMSIFKSLLIFACLSMPAYASERYIIDPQHTSSSFEYRRWFSIHHGNFNKVSGFIDFNPEQKTGHMTIEINSNSVSTGSDFFDKIMRSSPFFDTQHFHKIIFNSTNFVFDEDKLSQIEGKLTIKDTTKPVIINVTEFNCRLISANSKKLCDAAGQTKILRSDYQMSRFIPIVSDEITLYFSVEGIGED
jgi:polyisoprenoid-binding protein YceI